MDQLSLFGYIDRPVVCASSTGACRGDVESAGSSDSWERWWRGHGSDLRWVPRADASLISAACST
jgi:hypothetical protein